MGAERRPGESPLKLCSALQSPAMVLSAVRYHKALAASLLCLLASKHIVPKVEPLRFLAATGEVRANLNMAEGNGNEKT